MRVIVSNYATRILKRFFGKPKVYAVFLLIKAFFLPIPFEPTYVHP
jgi:hypothetical protein